MACGTNQSGREQRGYSILVENHGQPEVAIVDIVDFQLQRAGIHYSSSTKEHEHDLEISESMHEGLTDDQQRFNLVIGHYLAEHQSIGRSAELLRMSTPELMIHLGRAGVPLRVGPTSLEELKSDIETIRQPKKENRLGYPTRHNGAIELRTSKT